MTRKAVVITLVGAVLFVAGLPEITAILADLGLVDAARTLQSEFLTGSALTVVAALLFLLPGGTRWASRREPDTRVCSICDQRIARAATYCPRCGCRAS